MLTDRPGAESVGVSYSAFVLVGVEIELLELVHDRADRLALGGSEAGHQHVNLVLLNETPRELLPQSVVALPVNGNEVDLAPQNSLVTGIDEDIGILVEYHLGRALFSAIVDDVEADPFLADGRRVLGNAAECAEAAGSNIRTAFERLAFVDLLDGKLRGMKLLDAVN